MEFKSVIDLIMYFNTEKKCVDYLKELRWGQNVMCPHCEMDSPKVISSTQYKCIKKSCAKKFTVKTRSIYANSNLPLVKWIAAMYLFSSHKKGISSVQMAKDIGVTQKTAWMMLHKIRVSFTEEIPSGQLEGTIEADETFSGGKNKNRHKNKKVKNSQGRSYKDKTPILGILCRETKKAYCFVVADTTQKEIQPLLYKHIKKGSNLMTDEWSAYWGMNAYFDHNFIRHNIGEYANENTHTNNIEGFWSHLKRGIIGTYHKTSRKHLQGYANEFTFRYNTRFESETERLNYSMQNGFNKLISYKSLVGCNLLTGLT